MQFHLIWFLSFEQRRLTTAVGHRTQNTVQRFEKKGIICLTALPSMAIGNCETNDNRNTQTQNRTEIKLPVLWCDKRFGDFFFFLFFVLVPFSNEQKCYKLYWNPMRIAINPDTSFGLSSATTQSMMIRQSSLLTKNRHAFGTLFIHQFAFAILHRFFSCLFSHSGFSLLVK